MMVANVITLNEFRFICNRHVRTDFEEYWSLLTTVKTTKEVPRWKAILARVGGEHLTSAWKVLNQDKCWAHQSVLDQSAYKLAICGAYPDQGSREAILMQGCEKDYSTKAYLDKICACVGCYTKNVSELPRTTSYLGVKDQLGYTWLN